MMIEPRNDHLQWCKDRALVYCQEGDVQQAYASMSSDLGKHPETKDHPGISLGMMMLMTNSLSTKTEMIRFIKGFN